MRKGDRVEFPMEGTTKYGVVLKGGKNTITIILDGGERQVVGPASACKKSTHPLPMDKPSVMDKYSIAKYKDTGYGDETPQFNADIALNGEVVITAHNHGTGGCNIYRGDRSVIEQFEADAKEWGEQFGYPYKFEAHDTWVEWAAREKIYGVLAVDYFKNY